MNDNIFKISKKYKDGQMISSIFNETNKFFKHIPIISSSVINPLKVDIVFQNDSGITFLNKNSFDLDITCYINDEIEKNRKVGYGNIYKKTNFITWFGDETEGGKESINVDVNKYIKEKFQNLSTNTEMEIVFNICWNENSEILTSNVYAIISWNNLIEKYPIKMYGSNSLSCNTKSFIIRINMETRELYFYSSKLYPVISINYKEKLKGYEDEPDMKLGIINLNEIDFENILNNGWIKYSETLYYKKEKNNINYLLNYDQYKIENYTNINVLKLNETIISDLFYVKTIKDEIIKPKEFILDYMFYGLNYDQNDEIDFNYIIYLRPNKFSFLKKLNYKINSILHGELETLSYNLTEKSKYSSFSIDDLEIILTSDTVTPLQSTLLRAETKNNEVEIYYSIDNENWETYINEIIVTDNITYYFKTAYINGYSGTNKITFNNIDRIPPTVPIASANTTAPTNQNVIVTATFSEDSVIKQYSLDGETWNNYTEGITMADNGTVYFRGIDEAENISDVTSYEVTNIDKIAPTAPTVSADITEPTNQDVTITATFSEDTATKQYSYNNSSWQNYNENTGVKMAGNGTVYFRGLDAAGNKSDVSRYDVTNIDKTAPTIPTVSINPTSSTSGNVTVTATFSEDTVIKQYSLDGEIWNTYTGGITMTDNGRIYFKATDAVGNSSVKTNNVTNIDRTAPLINSISASPTSPTNGSVNVTPIFNESNVTAQYSFDNSEEKTWIDCNTNNRVTMTENGTVYFRGIDAAGNISEVSSYEVTNIDKIAPPPPVAYANTTEPTYENVTVFATFSETNSTKQYKYTYEGGSSNSWTTYPNTGFMATNNGTIYFREIDAAGNISEETQYNVENILHAISIQAENYAINALSGRVRAYTSFYDDDMYYSEDNENWIKYTSYTYINVTENKTYYFKAINQYGLESTNKVSFGNIVDNSMPLTFVANSANSKITLLKSRSPVTSSLFYRQHINDKWESYEIGTEISLKKRGDIVQFKNDAEDLSLDIVNYVYFEMSGSIFTNGNIKSLLHDLEICKPYCYYKLFNNCTSLIGFYNLPSETLDAYCYSHMFAGCTGLTNAPILPATTLAEGCYEYMFYNCTSLSTAPNLPAETLEPGCYANMFNRCSRLNSITVNFRAWNPEGGQNNAYGTEGWVDNVSTNSSYTFTKHIDLPEIRGYSNIPQYWRINNV